MILVVLYHSILFWNGNWFTANPAETSQVLAVLANWLTSFHIYGFALVSGYIFFYQKHEKKKYGEFVGFVANKAKRLLVPYVFTAVIWVIPVQRVFFRYTPGAFLKNYALAISPSQLWFLVMLFTLFVFFWLMSDFFARHDLLGAMVVMGIYGCSLVGGVVFPNVFQIWTACGYMPLFWLGFKLRQHSTRLIRKVPAVAWLAASILLFILTQYIKGVDNTLFKLLAIGFTFLTRVVGALMAFTVLQAVAQKVNWDNKVFAFLSRRSMTVYLFHQQIIYFVICLLNGVVNLYLNAALNFVVAMAGSLLMATVLLKFRTTRFLIGEKQ